MAIRASKLNLPLLLFAASTLALSAMSQSAGQPIIFSKPQTEAAPPGKSSLSPDNLQSEGLPDMQQAPGQFFDFGPVNARPPAPVFRGLSPQQQRMQQLLNDRKNWIFMTPEEILGVSATEKTLQPPERDALGREKNPTQLERFLQRESQARNGMTNGWRDDGAVSTLNFARDQDKASLLDSNRGRPTDATRSLSQILGGQRNDESAGERAENSGWDAFSQPLPQTTTTKPDPEQLAAMERFRQLFNPSPGDAAQTLMDGRFVPAPNLVDPFLTRPDFVPNPAGASFTPTSSGIGRPTGLTPLPDAVTGVLPITAAPTLKIQPAPWLSPGPQPFVIPQRKGF